MSESKNERTATRKVREGVVVSDKMDKTVAVSYTHLDVYKRQLLADDVVFTTAALDAFVSGPALGKSVKAVASSAEILDAPEPVAVKAVKEPKPAKAEKADEPAKEAKPAKADAAASEESKFGKGSFVGENPPAGYDIKGNADSMKFHTPASPWYEPVSYTHLDVYKRQGTSGRSPRCGSTPRRQLRRPVS